MNQEPKKVKKRIKNKRISIYLEEKDLEILDTQAEKLGLNRSEFVRRMCCSKSKELELFKEEHIGVYPGFPTKAVISDYKNACITWF